MRAIRRAPAQAPRLTCLLTIGLLLAPAAPAVAESGAYRIELLVFRYTDSQLEPFEEQELDDAPGAWRLDTSRAAFIPEDPAPLGVMSDLMRGAWRQLERQQDYEPLLFVNWEQSRIDYHPPVRVHDEETLHRRLDPPPGPVQVDLRTDDLFAPYRRAYFRLDGTAQLRRTRFLHLDLHLGYRVELKTPEPEPPGPDAAPAAEPVAAAADITAAQVPRPEPEDPAPAPYWNAPAPRMLPAEPPPEVPPHALRHTLHESRQVRTGDLLYFDTPYLGVLARVTATAGE